MTFAWLAATLSLATSVAGAAGQDPVAFSHGDWELVCDNTRTCRAAGYQDESTKSEPVSMRITRAAGPGTAIDVELQIGGEAEVKGTLRFKVGSATVSGLQGDAPSFDAKQVRTILPALLASEEATIVAGNRGAWTLSLTGLTAVLLKMDEVQGRVGTPGALVRRGAKPESSVLRPVDAPVVHAVRPPATRPEDAALAARIFPLIDLTEVKERCNDSAGVGAQSLGVVRLSGSKVMLSLGCSAGAYNSLTLLWTANDKPPYAPVALKVTGDYDSRDASVTAAFKNRGVGDCWSSETWHFNGKEFVRTAAVGDSMCRGFAGGAWSLLSYVSRVVFAPAATPSKP
ncbi:DUF1176 domain-containing protein [Variovorax ginsengisoli]|uniref:DUF1176 domain-containing protein n=1 Tax=Variovorax ginsengisoli TaxID=363844 RepID=A0ABT9S6H9_9BURK|nr:DUF1176 domain-containing protein [Variovorax ginsengisoli]MDP9899964.1 hypothetical protein [Variovorax ginsengisoli]